MVIMILFHAKNCFAAAMYAILLTGTWMIGISAMLQQFYAITVQQYIVVCRVLGYYAFKEGIPSTHQALWIDIPLSALGWFTSWHPSP